GVASEWIQVVSELAAQATTIAFLAGGSRFPTFEEQTNNMYAAARALGRQLIVLECRSEQDFNAAFTSIVERGAGALVVGVFPLFLVLGNRDKILEVGDQHKIPA